MATSNNSKDVSDILYTFLLKHNLLEETWDGENAINFTIMETNAINTISNILQRIV